MPSQRFWRITAPILIPVAGFLAAVLAETLTTLLLTHATFWLMRHEAIDTAVAVGEFAMFALSSAAGVYVMARFLVGREGPSRFGSAHLRHCGVLYLILTIAVVSHVRCAGECEGLILGSIKFYALFALGGILSDAWALRRQLPVPVAA